LEYLSKNPNENPGIKIPSRTELKAKKEGCQGTSTKTTKGFFTATYFGFEA